MNDTEDAVGSVASIPLNVFPQLEVRYRDGYRAAKFVVGFGNFIKGVGAIVGVLILLFSLTASRHTVGDSGPLLGLGVGLMVFLGFFVCGTIVCAQGQMLLAALDSAVNNSPFLDNPQRASIMSLSATMTSGSHRSHAEAKSAAQKAVDDATFF